LDISEIDTKFSGFLNNIFILIRTPNLNLRSILALQLETVNDLGRSFESTSSLLEERVSTTEAVAKSELDDFVLGALQSKILVALLLSKTQALSSGQITKRAGISASSWAKIKTNLMEQGLLLCTPKREMCEGRVIGSVEVKLTKKGILVAQNLLLIAGILGKLAPDEASPEKQLSPVVGMPGI
jgi:hypothetical protein